LFENSNELLLSIFENINDYLTSAVLTVLICAFSGYILGSQFFSFLLTYERSKEIRPILIGLFGVGLTVLANVFLIQKVVQLAWNIPAFFVGAIVGYFLTTRNLMNVNLDIQLPDALPIQSDKSKKAVIILSKGESKKVFPIEVIIKYRKKKELNVQQKNYLLQPFELYKLKRRYRELDKAIKEESSDDESINKDNDEMELEKEIEKAKEEPVLESYKEAVSELVTELDQSFLDVDFYQPCFSYDWPMLSDAVLSLVSRGANDITILPLFMSESIDYDTALDDIRRFSFTQLPIKIKEAPFLFESKKIRQAIARYVVDKKPSIEPGENVGVLLIAEGQPESLNQEYPLNKNIELFLNDLKEEIIDNGFREDLIRTAWLNVPKANVQVELEDLKKKCKTIIHVAATMPIDGIATLSQIPAAIDVESHPDTEFIAVNAWNNIPDIVDGFLGLITEAEPLDLEGLASDAKIILSSTEAGAKLSKISDKEKEAEEEKEKSNNK
jgi:protoheme ferro-lyase